MMRLISGESILVSVLNSNNNIINYQQFILSHVISITS